MSSLFIILIWFIINTATILLSPFSSLSPSSNHIKLALPTPSPYSCHRMAKNNCSINNFFFSFLQRDQIEHICYYNTYMCCNNKCNFKCLCRKDAINIVRLSLQLLVRLKNSPKSSMIKTDIFRLLCLCLVNFA